MIRVIRYDRPVTWGMTEPAYLWRAVRAAEIRRGLSHAQLAEVAGVTEHSIEELSNGRGACAVVLLRLEDWLIAEIPCSCGRAASQLSATGVPCCDDHAHSPHLAVSP